MITIPEHGSGLPQTYSWNLIPSRGHSYSPGHANLCSRPALKATARMQDARHSEAEDEDEDVRELQSLFPPSLRFLDLSSLGLKQELPHRFPSPLYLRQEYKVLSELIEKQPQNGGSSVIVSDQPGTGEFLVSLRLSHKI